MQEQSDIMDSELGCESSPGGNGVAIRVHNLSKVYRLYDRPIDRLKESLHPFRRNYHHDFHALKDVSFQIGKGETFGIIGKNGSGKSTLLKIIAGVLTPSHGTLEVRGKVSALLELGIGFNPDMTGIENIYFSGTIMGYSPEEIDAKVDDILAFADIGEFVHQPMKTYSSGMFVRLAFAVATKVDPEILVVDEALAVGDMFFQSKCMLMMKKMIDRGMTLLFVSHDTSSVTNLCRRAIYLENGAVKTMGEAISVTDQYLKDMRQLIYRASPEGESPSRGLLHVGEEISMQSRGTTPPKEKVELPDRTYAVTAFKVDPAFTERVQPYRYGTGGARVTAMELINQQGELAAAFRLNEWITVRAYIECYKEIDFLSCCILIRNRSGIEITHATSFTSKFEFPALKAGERIVVDIRFQNIYKGGETYTIHYTVNNTEQIETTEIMDLIELAAYFESLRDENNQTYYLIYYPFQFNYTIL
ncbi:MAG: ABC transporter ATP-binding protein [Deltaproteobacteria bacterium]|nr:ABC transporter ATP-binding protein [Deltaproteobacteria bacterium]